MSLTDSSTRSIQVVSGSSTVVFTAPNVFTYSLPTSGFNSMRDEVALKSLSVYYSFPNISAAATNNTFAYIWQSVQYPVVIPDGIWSFPDMYSYWTQVMYSNGHYLVDSYGTTTYFFSLIVNPVLYALSLTCTPLPSSLPSGWSNPAHVDLTQPSVTPQMIITAGGPGFGFAIGSYPPTSQSSVYQVNSGIPQISSVTSLNVLCNLVDNGGFSLSPNVLASFGVPNNQAPGSLIQILPTNLDWEPVSKQRTFVTIELSIVDQKMNAIQIRDPSGFVAILNIRRKSLN